MSSQSLNTAFNTRRLVITGMLIAVSIILAVPLNAPPFVSLGFITFGGISFTFMHVPAIIGAVLEGPVVGLIVGGAFGLFSMFLANQQTGADAIFRDPIISVLPRLFIGPVAWLVFNALKKANPMAALGGAGVAGTLTNTLLVIGAIAIRLSVPFLATLASVAVNVAIEVVVAVVLVIAVVNALRNVGGGRGGSSV